MAYPVRYHCPRCGTVVTLQRVGYLADKSVTPYPLEGWTYADVDGDYDQVDGDQPSGGDSEAVALSDGTSDETRRASSGEPREPDGVRIVCGESSADDRIAFDGPGCGERFYLNFVRYEDGREVEPDPEPERVELAHPHRPRGPQTPDGPGS